jgi:hypothetical protein
MSKGFQITFSMNPESYGVGLENDQYSAYIGIKHQKNTQIGTEKEQPRKKLKPYRRPKRCKN